MQFGKSSEKLRAKTERQIQEAQERISALQKWQKRWVSNMTRHCHPPCASLLPVNRYRPHFPVKPGLSGERNAVLPVVVNSVLLGCDVSEQLELISSAFKVMENRTSETGLLPVRPYRAGTSTFKTHCTQLCRSGASRPMLSPGNMQTICRYTASQKYTVVREWSCTPCHTGALDRCRC